MRKLLVFAAVLLQILTMQSFAKTLILDPGNPDSVFIGIDATTDVAVIPIDVKNDDNVDYINIPIHYDNLAFEYDSCRFVGQVAGFDDISAIDRAGASMVTIFGWSNLNEPPNDYLNTGYQRVTVAYLYFSVLPATPEDTYPLEVTTDPLNGFLIFGDANGMDEWIPMYENGFIQVVSEEGFADSVSVSTTSVMVGEPATVAVSIVNDEDVSHITIPISFTAAHFNFVGFQLFGDINSWTGVMVEQTPGTEIICISGTAPVGGPYLNNNGSSEIAVELYFSTNPAAPEAIYPFNIVTDPIYGSLSFSDQYANQWMPFSRNGSVQIFLPPSCNMQYSYLWAYGFCQSPSVNRQYASRIMNNGADPAVNVTLAIAFPSMFTYQSSSPVASVVGNLMTWNLGTINPGASIRVDWWVDIPADIGGDTVITVADITSSTADINIFDNHREFIEIVGFSYDPNDKVVDPFGFGPDKFIDGSGALMYTVYFENSDSATLPATDILIVDTLDTKLNWNTVTIGPMSHPEPCSVWFDPGPGIITCFCDDIMLPPNEDPPEGEGFFSFSIYPRWNLETGDVINNRAFIRFDLNDWIAAPGTAPVFVKLDLTKPVSNVLPLQENYYNISSFDVSWQGSDGLGSGVAYYDIFVSIDGNPFELWIDNIGSTTAIYYPELDHSYAFYSVATDNIGRIETVPFYPDAITRVSGGCAYLPGDINGNGQSNGIDVVYGVSYLKGGNPPPIDCSPQCPAQPNPFFAAGDVNGNCAFNGIDITYFVAYLKGIQPALLFCQECAPAGSIIFSRQIEDVTYPEKVISEPAKEDKPVAPNIRPALKPRGSNKSSD